MLRGDRLVAGDWVSPVVTTVLLVDDQELVRSGLRLILELAGITVVGEAADGAEAFALAGETPMASSVMARLIKRFIEPSPQTTPTHPG